MNITNNITNFIKKFSRRNTFPTFCVLILIILLNALLQPGFFTPAILRSNISTFSPLILVSIAQAVIILVGGIDLSIGTSITLVNVILASTMKDTVGSVFIALILGLCAALTMGLINGLSVAYLRLPAIVATFATSAIWYGFSLLIMPQPGGYVPPFFYRLYLKDILYIIPFPLAVIIIAFLIWQFFKNRRVGRYIYAVGGNEDAAEANGINSSLTKLFAYIIAGLLTFLAAAIVTTQTASGDANVGETFTLTSVAAAVIGGVSLQGGKGSLAGAAMGACILGMLINIIYFANIPSMYQEFIKGFIIIIALGLAVLPKIKQAKFSI
ncbi:MAG: ABC transporter permease [Acetivibrionales bacterium]|jgi:ribose transport system permease protein